MLTAVFQHELNCLSCVEIDPDERAPGRDCRRCFFSQSPALDDRFYLDAVRPYCWFAAALLFLSYIIGLWFTLRTHAAVIWNNESDEKKIQDAKNPPPLRLQRQTTQLSSTEASRTADIRDSQLYKRILGQSLKHAGIGQREEVSRDTSTSELQGSNASAQAPQTPHLVPPKSSEAESPRSEFRIPGLSEVQNTTLVREVAELAATAATIAARDATRDATKIPRKPSTANVPQPTHKSTSLRTGVVADDEVAAAESHGASGGGHDAPNWGRMKSSVILCGATVLYALIAEILVNTVDVVLKNVAIDEKFLGITLFALVPNTTEFLVRLQ
jgi:Ca2+:H+ antiporter